LVNAPNNAKTLNLLIKYVINTWDRLRESLLNKLINIIKRRVKAIIEAEGWYIKY
jgi:hypothetical protein